MTSISADEAGYEKLYGLRLRETSTQKCEYMSHTWQTMNTYRIYSKKSVQYSFEVEMVFVNNKFPEETTFHDTTTEGWIQSEYLSYLTI